MNLLHLIVLVSMNLDQMHCLSDQSLVLFMMKLSEEEKIPDSPTVINAFQLIGMSSFLDLSGLFETEVTNDTFLVLCFKIVLF